MALNKILGFLGATNSGRIIAYNMILSFEKGIIEESDIKEFVTCWGDFIKANDYSGELSETLDENEVYASLSKLVAKVPSASKFHISNKCTVSDVKEANRASIRNTHTLRYFLDKKDLDRLRTHTSTRVKPGSVAYELARNNAEKIGWQSVAFSNLPEASITRRDFGEFAVFWYTKADKLINRLDKTPYSSKADLVRNRLGLIHQDASSNLIAIHFDKSLVEKRSDTGRPTFIDANTNPRFKSIRSDETAHKEWGEAVDLAKIESAPSEVGGFAERVSGPALISDYCNDDKRDFGLYFLYNPKIPRHDTLGVNDSKFLDVLKSFVVTSDYKDQPETFIKRIFSMGTK